MKHFAVAVLAAVGAMAVFVVIAAITGMSPRISGGIALAVAIALGIKVFRWRRNGVRKER